MITCLIVDDEIMSRKLLENHINKNEHLKLVKQCENVKSAIDYLSENEVDLIFLDIEMPGANGFELIEQCPILPFIIITSSKEEYAYEAFEYQVDDYLRKPIKIPRFQQAIQKIINKNIKPSNDHDSIFIKVDGKHVKIELKDILFIENVGDYVKFKMNEKSFIVHSTLKRLIQKLPQKKFMKVHRSFIINLDKIVDIEENSLLIQDHLIPVSRANKAPLMERLNLI